MKSYSIKRQLVAAIVTGCAIIFVIVAVFLDILIGFEMQKMFDEALLDKARTLQTLLEQKSDKIEFKFADEVMPDFDSSKDPKYFQIWLDDNLVLERSRSLGQGNLPRFQTPFGQQTFQDIALPDGRPGRLVEIAFVPRVDIEEIEVHPVLSDSANAKYLTLAVARERGTLQQHRFASRIVIGGAMFTMLFGVAVLVKKFVSHGLLSIEHLSAQMGRINAHSLGRRVAYEGTRSVELAPIEDQINSLLGRLEAAFQREKRFSADVAHELRTPISELKTLAEVGMWQPTDRDTVLAFFGDVKDISVQMEKTVETLLALARVDAGQLQIYREDLHLAAVVDSVWAGSIGGPASTQLRNEIAEDLLVYSDLEKLEMILRNLLTNAAAYSPPGTCIRVFATQSRDDIELGIENRVIDLQAADLPRMRMRFWRKDQARSKSEHSGLGLALVEALAGVLALKVRLSLDDHQVFRVVLQGLGVR